MFKTISTSTKAVVQVFLITIIVSCNEASPEREAATGQNRGQSETPADSLEGKKGEEPLTEETAEDFLSAYAKKNPENEALINTPHGDIRIRLYENTPLHRANFLYLARQGYFDGTWFYRVSKDHVVQAGNTDSRETVKRRMKLGEYKVPSEINPGNYHKRGAVAAARSYYQNPEKASDPYEFYIVLGKPYSRSQLQRLAEKHDMTFSERQLDFYSDRAGSPHLDGEHTVFGEVVEGMDVVEKINYVEVDEGEWPLTNIPIEVKILE